MSKNRMGEVLDLLGIVEGVEYDVVYITCGFGKQKIYKGHGLMLDTLLQDLILGLCYLVPRPWVPKPGEKFYYIDICDIDGTGYYTCHSVAELELLIKRGVAFYRTHDEALQAVEEKYNSGEWER